MRLRHPSELGKEFGYLKGTILGRNMTKRKKQLDDMVERLRYIEDNIKERQGAEERIEGNLEEVKKDVDNIATNFEQEKEKEKEMNRSFLFIILEKILQVFLFISVIIIGGVGKFAYSNIVVFRGNWFGTAVKKCIIWGNQLLALYIIIRLVIDLMGGYTSETQDNNPLKEGIICKRIVKQLSRLKLGIKSCSTRKRYNKETILSLIPSKVKKEFLCVMGWLITVHFASQMIAGVYILICRREEVWYWLIGAIAYVCLILISEIREQIIKRGYVYVYNLFALVVAIISLGISLKPYWQDLMK